MNDPEVLSSRVILKTPWLTLRNDTIKANGNTMDFHFVSRKNTVAVIAITPEGKVALVREYKYGASKFVWQLPAGKIDEGESPVNAARREVKEETGCDLGGEVKFLGQWYVDSSWCPDIVYCYVAEIASRGERSLDDTEILEASFFTWDEITKMLHDNEVWQPHTVAALLLFKSKMEETIQ